MLFLIIIKKSQIEKDEEKHSRERDQQGIQGTMRRTEGTLGEAVKGKTTRQDGQIINDLDCHA